MCQRVGLCPAQQMGAGEAEPSPAPLPEKLQALRAVREHQADLRRLRSTWLSRAKESLGGTFLKAAEMVMGSMDGQRELNVRALHEHLDRYQPLLQVMHLVDPTSLHAVRSLYTQALNPGSMHCVIPQDNLNCTAQLVLQALDSTADRVDEVELL